MTTPAGLADAFLSASPAEQAATLEAIARGWQGNGAELARHLTPPAVTWLRMIAAERKAA